jgi:hypothetical protein
MQVVMKYSTRISQNILRLVIFLLLCIPASLSAQVSELAAPPGTPWFYTDYSNPFFFNDKVFVFRNDETTGGQVFGQLSITGGTINSQYKIYRLEDDPSLPAYQQFIEIEGDTLSGYSVLFDSLETGLYQVIVTTDAGTVNEKIVIRRAQVLIANYNLSQSSISPGCTPFYLSANPLSLANSYLIHEPPSPDSCIVDESTVITICMNISHSFISEIGFQLGVPGNGIVELLPNIMAWNSPGVTTLDAADVMPFPCSPNPGCASSGNNYSNFCFSSALPSGDSAFTACVCGMPTPITGTFASAGPWTAAMGQDIQSSGWGMRVVDCWPSDLGAVTNLNVSFIGLNYSSFNYQYNSGSAIFTIYEKPSCQNSEYSIIPIPYINNYIQSSQLVTDSIHAHWVSDPVPWDTAAWGSPDYSLNPTPYIDPIPNVITNFSLVFEGRFYREDGTLINDTSINSYNATSSQEFIPLDYDPTIYDIPISVCESDSPFELFSVMAGGVWTASCGTYPAGCVTENGIFYPQFADIGLNSLTYSFSGPCSEDTSFTIFVTPSFQIDTVSEIYNNDQTQFQLLIQVSNLISGHVDFNNCFTGQAFPGNFDGVNFISDWIPVPYDYCLFIVEDSLDCTTQWIEGSVLLSSSNISDSAIQVYPNPTSGTLHIVGLPKEKLVIQLQNKIGKNILAKSCETGEIILNLENVSKGEYILLIKANSELLYCQSIIVN